VIVGQFVPQMTTWKVRKGGKHLLCPLILCYVDISPAPCKGLLILEILFSCSRTTRSSSEGYVGGEVRIVMYVDTLVCLCHLYFRTGKKDVTFQIDRQTYLFAEK
jgi:hypothetical protein